MRFQTVSLDGPRRPVIPVFVESNSGSRLIVDGLVDTGSDLTLLPERVAIKLGFDISQAAELPLKTGVGVSGSYRECEVILEIRWEGESLRWRTQVGIYPGQMRYCLLGTKGFFEFFDLNYSARQQLFELRLATALPQ